LTQFVLHHYREPAQPAWNSVGHPFVVMFDPADPAKRENVLLFLIKEKDGRYAAFAGQTDPNYQAIFTLSPVP
jgi:hypothetical protein